MQYKAEDLVKVAKRDNNSIRPYLYVNPKQGKHIPTDPSEIVNVCSKLAELINAKYPEEKLYVIGFAETATGIAAQTCHYLNNVEYYQNTTREYDSSANYLLFEESHSHATNQLLTLNNVKKSMVGVDRIVIVDDEITTGNTALKLINALKSEINDNSIKFSIVSILNSMSSMRISELKQIGIDCIFLASIPFEYKKDSIIHIDTDNSIHTITQSSIVNEVSEYEYYDAVNARRIASFNSYDDSIRNIAGSIVDSVVEDHYGEILLLGTEEFMYPAFCLGEMIKSEKLADAVKIHATTRSPIVASTEKGYPLFHRYQMRSPYDDFRTTYIYNLKKYDKVFILTDAEGVCGINDLVSALESVGNKNISIIRWHYAA